MRNGAQELSSIDLVELLNELNVQLMYQTDLSLTNNIMTYQRKTAPAEDVQQLNYKLTVLNSDLEELRNHRDYLIETTDALEDRVIKLEDRFNDIDLNVSIEEVKKLREDMNRVIRIIKTKRAKADRKTDRYVINFANDIMDKVNNELERQGVHICALWIMVAIAIILSVLNMCYLFSM